jgi:hypothetical protein
VRERAWVTDLVWFSYYEESDQGFNIVDPTTLAETQTFAAFRATGG